MAHIAITATSFLRDPRLVQYARGQLAGHTLELADPALAPLDGPALAAMLAHADALLVGREPITAALLATLPRLETISVYGVGYDNVDVAACRHHGIELLVAHGVNADAVAEHTLGLMIALCRNIAQNDRRLRQGAWRKNGGAQLSAKTVAIVGCGHVGSRLAMLLRALGCSLLLCDLHDVGALAAQTGARQVSLENCLRDADVVSLHVPSTELTRQMINPTTLALMKPGAFLVNTSRGPVVSLEALKNALRTGQLAGAALDVFEREPLADKELVAFEQVVLTPHTAGNAREAVWAMGKAAVDLLQQRLT